MSQGVKANPEIKIERCLVSTSIEKQMSNDAAVTSGDSAGFWTPAIQTDGTQPTTTCRTPTGA